MSNPSSHDARPHRVAVLEPDLRVRNALFRLLAAAEYDVSEWPPADQVTGDSGHDVAIVDPTASSATLMLTASVATSSPPIILLAQHPELVSTVMARRATAVLSKTCDPQDLLNALQAALTSFADGLVRHDRVSSTAEAERKVQPS